MRVGGNRGHFLEDTPCFSLPLLALPPLWSGPDRRKTLTQKPTAPCRSLGGTGSASLLLLMLMLQPPLAPYRPLQRRR